MSEIPNKYIKVNIPLTERDYLSGERRRRVGGGR